MFRLMAVIQAQALRTLPGIAGQAKRFRLMGHAQGFVRVMALLTMGALSSASFAVSLGGPVLGSQSCPSPLGIATLPPQLYGTYLPWDLPLGRDTICPGTVSGKACSGHYVYVPGTPAGALVPTMRAPLFVFLPGTGGEPNKYEHLLQMAAYAGYRTIGLAYDSDQPVESSCPEPLTCGGNCLGLVRDEIITGQDTSGSEEVEVGDAILPRLYDLLTALHLADPANDYGWDAYYVPATDPATITLDNFVWSDIIVSGHSQGAGHAEKISVDRQVHGIVVFEGGRDTCEKIEIVRNPIPRVIRKTVAAEWASTVPAGGASAGRPRYALSYTDSIPFSVHVTWRALGFPSTAASLDAPLIQIPPVNVAHTMPDPPAGCNGHEALAIGESLAGNGVHQCLPVNRHAPAGAPNPAAAQAQDTYLFPYYLTRLCYACDRLTCP